MSENYLITGYHGKPHVTAENDRGINAGIFGAGRFVLAVGEQFRVELIGNNIIRMYDGKLIDNGAAAGIPAGEYIDFHIPYAGQGQKRVDQIIFQYEKEIGTLVETGSFIHIKGAETSATPVVTTLQQVDLLTGNARIDQMQLYRFLVTDTSIQAEPVQTFEVRGGDTSGIFASNDISLDFLPIRQADSAPIKHTNVSVYKYGNIVSGRITFEGDFEEAAESQKAWTVKADYRPKQGFFVGQGLLYTPIGNIIQTDYPPVVFRDGKLYVSDTGLGTNVGRIEVSFTYICA